MTIVLLVDKPKARAFHAVALPTGAVHLISPPDSGRNRTLIHLEVPTRDWAKIKTKDWRMNYPLGLRSGDVI